MRTRLKTPWLAVLVGCAISLSGCGDDPAPIEEETPSPVDRLVRRLDEATIRSVLQDTELLPAPADAPPLLAETFRDPSLPGWREAILGTGYWGPVTEGACVPEEGLATFPNRKGNLCRPIGIQPQTVLLLEAKIRAPASDEGLPPIFLTEYRGLEIFENLSLLRRAQEQARLVPVRTDEIDEEGFATYRLVWRTGPVSKALAISLSPSASPEAPLALRSVSLTNVPPLELVTWLEGADAVGENPFAVRYTLDQQRADALLALPPTRFEFPLESTDHERFFHAALAIHTAQLTGREGSISLKVNAVVDGSENEIHVTSLATVETVGKVAWSEVGVPIPKGATQLILETARESQDSVGLMPVYIIDPVAVQSIPSAPPRPNVILISLDTLRADRTSAYGYERPTSPYLQELCESSVRFERGISPAAYTLPSHVTILSGQYPVVHTVKEVRDRIRHDRTVLLSERLRDEGYRTAAFTGGLLVHSTYGFEAGFDRYSHRDVVIRRGMQRLIDWINPASASPFFLFFHTYAIHDFIIHDERIEEQFHPGDCSSELHGQNYFMWGAVDREEGATDEDKRHVSDLYDGSIAYTDRILRGFFAHLEKIGLADETIVVITSDHGKEILDRRLLAHGHTVYDEMVHVPLIIRAPGVSPRVVSEVVSTADIVPTIFDLMGLEAPDEIQGRSLLPLMMGEELTPRPVLAEQIRRPLRKLALYDDRYKLMRRELMEGEDWQGLAPQELFDMVEDPSELRDLNASSDQAAVYAAKLDRFLERLERVKKGLDARATSKIDKGIRPELLESLRQHGYVH